ncbi:MAG: DUF1848 domain-containing protein [Exilispira sp.]
MDKIWEEVEIKAEDGRYHKAIAPLILSASRATDIPAFYSKWFFNRLNKGFLFWENPFNKKYSKYISFEKVRVIVFWSKYPQPILPYLKILDEKKINYYFQFTLNDYENEGFESNLPSIYERIKTFINLSRKIGRERVIWRFDPLVLSKNLKIDDLIDRIRYIGNKLKFFTEKLVVSFVDIDCYKNVQRRLIRYGNKNFNKENIFKNEFTENQKIEFSKKLSALILQWKKINPDFKVSTCSENIDLSRYNIMHNKCVDDELMIRLFNDDKILMEFLGYSIEKNTSLLNNKNKRNLKDRGQRKECNCIFSKDIGFYNSCKFNCIYCYAKR